MSDSESFPRPQADTWFGKAIEQPAAAAVGGWQRLKIIVLLACVLGLDGADKGTIGALGAQLEKALNIGNTEVGLLVTASTLIGAIATLPVGVLVDQVHRKRLLAGAIVVWSAAMIVSGFSNSYLMLLLTRLALGAIVATAAPAVASLTGDLFPSFERGRIWGYLLGGELLGSAFGYLVSGTIAGLVSWRAAFWLLGLLGFVLAAFVAWQLIEPKRGGQARLPPFFRPSKAQPEQEYEDSSENDDALEKDLVAYGIRPHEERVLQDNPGGLSLWQAARQILSIRTNVLLIIASALGYFYFTGLRTFAVVFISGRFGLPESTASMLTVAIGLGAIIGVFITGRLADRLIESGYISARVWIGGTAFLLTAGFLLPGLLSASLYITLPLFFFAAMALGGTNPPLDAARLDIIHSRLWGRAESIRTALRYVFEAAAPLAFGYVSSLFGSGGGATGPVSAKDVQTGAVGLKYTLMIMLIMLIAGGLILLVARRSYPRDAATALASEHATPD